VTIAEIAGGIAKLRRQGGLTRAASLEDWLAAILALYGPRILPLDTVAARATGLLADQARATGHDPGFADLAIAGIARANGLAVLTRSLRHFAPLDVAARDPLGTLAD
jgi:predicted nucleic acid-binding protein